VASESYILQSAATPHRGRYFDVVEYEEFALRSQTPNTPALSLLYAADAQLATIVQEGIEVRWARHAAMQAETTAWVNELQAAGIPIAFLPSEGERSHTVSALTLPPGLRSADVVKRVAELGFVIGGGYGALKDSTIRIGHMGDHTVDTLRPCLAAVRHALQSAAG
jgi:aspartate aminotransferase-like enzyme